MSYTIIIPVYNEEDFIYELLKRIKQYYLSGHEIIIINDGSTDNSLKILKENNFIRVISFRENRGKGVAIKTGLKLSKHDKVIIFDSDLELDPDEIKKLMILDKDKGIHSVMGSRYSNFNPFLSSFEWGNFMFTCFFNLTRFSTHKDILCCAKSFYNNDIKKSKIKSKGFDIDIELSSMLTKNNRYKSIKQIFLSYNRRYLDEGKKLQISDGWVILRRAILTL